MKKQIAVVVSVLLLIAGLAIVYSFQSKPFGLRECPDEWIENRMPGPKSDNSQKQYFIFNGERKEVKGYDISWIKSSCSVQVQYAY